MPDPTAGILRWNEEVELPRDRILWFLGDHRARKSTVIERLDTIGVNRGIVKVIKGISEEY
jgi:hypothetical protein